MPMLMFRDFRPPARGFVAYPDLLDKQGFTLIELMIAVALSGVVIAAIYNVFISQYRSSIIQDQVAEMQQNARIAMEFLARDIRMAGFGVPATEVNGFENEITAANNINNGTDEITIVAAYDQVSTLSDNALKGNNTIILQSSTDANKFNTGAKRYLCLEGISQEDNYEVIEIIGNQLTVSPDLTRNYSVNCPVFLVKAITYRIDFADPNHPCLRRDENTGGGAQQLAENIEDLQLAYQDKDGNWFDSPPVAEDIRAVRINILARTSREDPNWRLGIRPPIEDHAGAQERDGYRRRLLTTVVKVRNMGL